MNFSHSALFHTNTKVCLTYFGQDCGFQTCTKGFQKLQKAIDLTVFKELNFPNRYNRFLRLVSELS